MLSTSRFSAARWIVGPLLAGLLLGCDSPVHPNAPEQPGKKQPPPPDSATTGQLERITLTGDTSWAYVDRDIGLAVKATDAHGNLVDAELAEIST